MVDMAQLVERQVVALDAVSSSLTIHPIRSEKLCLHHFFKKATCYRGVAKR